MQELYPDNTFSTMGLPTTAAPASFLRCRVIPNYILSHVTLEQPTSQRHLLLISAAQQGRLTTIAQKPGEMLQL